MLLTSPVQNRRHPRYEIVGDVRFVPATGATP
jgi:hypothetical protein